MCAQPKELNGSSLVGEEDPAQVSDNVETSAGQDSAIGVCQYKKGRCKNPRALKRNGKPHTLCEFHRKKQIEYQRNFDKKTRETRQALKRKSSDSSLGEPGMDDGTGSFARSTMAGSRGGMPKRQRSQQDGAYSPREAGAYYGRPYDPMRGPAPMMAAGQYIHPHIAPHPGAPQPYAAFFPPTAPWYEVYNVDQMAHMYYPDVHRINVTNGYWPQAVNGGQHGQNFAAFPADYKHTEESQTRGDVGHRDSASSVASSNMQNAIRDRPYIEQNFRLPKLPQLQHA